MPTLAEEYEALWEGERGAPDVFAFHQVPRGHGEATPEERAGVLAVDIRWRMLRGLEMPLETCLERVPEVSCDPLLRLRLVLNHRGARLERGEAADLRSCPEPFPDLREELARLSTIEVPHGTGSGGERRGGPGNAGEAGEAGGDEPFPEGLFDDREWEEAVGGFAEEVREVARYRVEEVLADGACKRVYRARDDRLERTVAVKVPHAHVLAEPGKLEEFRREARTIAGLDHPGITRVIEADGTEDGLCYIVERYVEGEALAGRSRVAPRGGGPSRPSIYLSPRTAVRARGT